MNESPEVRCLIITSIFPPMKGGSAVVYENLCRYAPKGSAFVLTCWRHYVTGKNIDNWTELDKKAQYPINRIELLRPLSQHSKSRFHSLWLLITNDFPLNIKILYQASQVIRANKINVICIGELVSGSWLGLV